MICAWKELLSILPQWMRAETDKQGRDTLQEIRLRCHAPPELVMGDKVLHLNRTVTREDLQFTVNCASRYSPWAAETAALGYLCAPGGHRVGICGDAVVQEGRVTGVSRVSSLCIRVARDFPGIASSVPASDSVLILGAPGWGKTTLLRDLARRIAERDTVAVVDERGELYPEGLARGRRMDVLSLCPKPQGIDRLLRTMGPQWIAVDEITAEEDCEALIRAMGCGIKLMATAHASSIEDLNRRPVYRKLKEAGIFRRVILLDSRKQWRMERMDK